mgnify:CR=1 FL=1
MTDMFFSRPDDESPPVDVEVTEADNGLRLIGDTIFDFLRAWLIIVATGALIIVLIRIVVIPAFFLADLVS